MRTTLQAVVVVSFGSAAVFSGCRQAVLHDVTPRQPPTLCGNAAIPQGLGAQSTPSGVTLQWAALEPGLEGVLIERRVTGQTWGELERLAADASTFADDGAAHDEQLEYRLRALSSVEGTPCVSSPSDAASVTTTPLAATTPTSETLTSTSVR